MKKVTVWEINGPMNAGGTESLIMELLRNQKKDVNIVLIVLVSQANETGIFDNEIKALGVPIHYLPSVGSVGIREFTKRFSQLVKKIGKPDIIHSHLNAVSGFIVRAAKKNGIKHRIVHCHADIRYQGDKIAVLKSEIGLFVMKLFVNYFGTHFWACSKRAAERLFYNRKEYMVIPNMIDVSKYLNASIHRHEERERLGIDDDVIAIGAVGRISPIKNYEIIIDALEILKKEHLNVHFFCYGRVVNTGYYQSLISKVKEKELMHCVSFLGNSDKIHEKLGAFDLYVMPSHTEGLSISLLEAQAAGLPALASTGVPDEADMSLGLVKRVSPHDAHAWATAIKSIEPKNVDQEAILQAFRKRRFDSKTSSDYIFDAYKEINKE